MKYEQYTRIKARLDGTMCRICYKKKIRIQIHFGPLVPGVCDDCHSEMFKLIMERGHCLPHSNMEKKDD